MKQDILLVIGFTWPEPASTAAGNRMLELLRFFKEEGYRIVFASTASQTELSLDLKALAIESMPITLNDSGFDLSIKELNPDIVIFDRFLTEEQFGWRIAESLPNAIRVLDTEDLHSLRKARETAHKKHMSFSLDDWQQSDVTKREVASIYRSDLSLMVSTFEMELLTKRLAIDEDLLVHLPFLLDPIDKGKQGHWPAFDQRSGFVCIGNGRHAPNVDALLFLSQEIWPLIRKGLPDAQLSVYGAYLPQRIQELHRPDQGFHIKGWAEDANKVLGRARLNLAPLRFGAGIKGKLTSAMQNGTPSVTTHIGAEGMHAEMPWSGAIAHTAEDFAEAALRLYHNKEEWTKAQNNGLAIVNTSYDRHVLEKRLKEKINGLARNLKAHRNKNFIGTLLLHQTMQATKYLSKWIEEKNAKN
ncbi:glycosyltransferase [Zobellia uliginosa]|uniref:glycosyltransferase n=1 Tax=Zobellia uliginosa TaxID=143224 RepID=UPI0026E2BC48|nr:glycosyltransferase [Zobellia uliginosa]MDO6517895.1 glycosyltransferase [Zobellia uliginosa]